MRKDAAEKLSEVLDMESAALRNGQLDALDPLSLQKSQLLVNLQAERSRSIDLASIRAKAARNEALLAAAIRGVQNARTRLSDLQAVKDNLRVYSKEGLLLQKKSKTSAVERKA